MHEKADPTDNFLLVNTNELNLTECFTCEKHRFKLSVVVNPTTRSSAMPQSYTDKRQSEYVRTLGLITAVISSRDKMRRLNRFP